MSGGSYRLDASDGTDEVDGMKTHLGYAKDVTWKSRMYRAETEVYDPWIGYH